MPEIGEIVDVDPFAAASPSSSGGGPQVGDVVDYDPFAPQTNIWGEIAEVGRGIPAGAVHAAGTALRGLAANQPAQRYASYLDEIEHGVLYRTREREGRVPITDDQAYTDILQRIAEEPGMPQSPAALRLRNALERARGAATRTGIDRGPRRPSRRSRCGSARCGRPARWFLNSRRRTSRPSRATRTRLGRAVGEGLGSLGRRGRHWEPWSGHRPAVSRPASSSAMGIRRGRRTGRWRRAPPTSRSSSAAAPRRRSGRHRHHSGGDTPRTPARAPTSSPTPSGATGAGA